MRFIGLVILYICLLGGCIGCHNSKKTDVKSELCRPEIVSDHPKSHFLDGVFPIIDIEEKSDTIVTCSSYQGILDKGLQIDKGLSKILNIKCNPDSTITPIRAFKYKSEIIACFIIEYSDLSEIAINLYDSNGVLEDMLKLNFSCCSDVVDSNDKIEKIIQNYCCLLLNGNILSYETHMYEKEYNIETDTYTDIITTDSISTFRCENQSFVKL